MKPTSEKEMDRRFDALRRQTAPASLHERVERVTVETRVRRPRRYGQLLAAACVVAVFLAIAYRPQPANAVGLFARMARAMDGVKTVHHRRFSFVTGKWVLTNETWYADGNWRRTGPDGTSIYGAGKKWRYQPDQGLAIESERELGDDPDEAELGFKLKAGYEAMNRQGFESKLYYGQPRRLGARTVVEVMVTRDPHPTERDVWQVDAQSDLALSGESQVQTPSGWQPRMKFVCEYNVPVPAGTFAASFPTGTRVLDAKSFGLEWGQRLAQPLATFQAGGETVAIRNVFVNSRGSIFLLWTGNIGGAANRLSVEDNLGRQYVRAFFNPGVPMSKEYGDNPLTRIDGKLLDGAWFVPLETEGQPVPMSFTLHVRSFTLPKIEGLGGSYGGVLNQRPFEPTEYPMCDGVLAKPKLAEIGECTFEATKPSPDALPAYMPLFGDGPRTGLQGRYWAEEARKHYWMLRLNDVPLPEKCTRALVPPLSLDGEPIGPNVQLVVPTHELPASSNPAILRRLESVLIEEGRLSRELHGDSSGFDWFELSVVQQALGETEAAEASLRHAELVRPEIRWR